MVFFEEPDGGWRLASFQGDKPEEAAEVEFQYLLDCKLPQAIVEAGKAVLMPDGAAAKRLFPRCGGVFEGHSVIAASIKHGSTFGIRIAWREESDPFTQGDLETLVCTGDCPDMSYPA